MASSPRSQKYLRPLRRVLLPIPDFINMAPFNPVNDPLGQLIGLQQQAQQKRFAAAVANPATQAGPLPDPNWDAYFGAVNEAGGGMPTNFAGGASPAGSNQLTGFQAPSDVGTEQYGPRGMQFARPGVSTRLQGLQQSVKGTPNG